MAILFGTQSNGETLPVLVDQFGNLLAKGIEGEPGPPGPPGIGQLPPDPVEGALLGWEDGVLAWVGGVIPLPAGTYGPFTYDANAGTLTVEQDVSALINGQQLFMSDNQGNIAQKIVSTNSISNVLNIFNQGLVAWNAPYNTLPTSWDNMFGAFAYLIYDDQQLVIDTQSLGNTIVSVGQDPSGFRAGYRGTNDGNSYTTVFDNQNQVQFDGSFPFRYFVAAVKRDLVGQGPASMLINTEVISSGTQLLFPDTSSFNYFNVGDVVQEPNVTITGIDFDNSSMVLSGGSWCGSDGSGDCNSVRGQSESTSTENVSSKVSSSETSITKTLSGAGSVLTSSANTIILRSDNGEWVNGFFVTSPEQLIAARKAFMSPEFRAEMRHKQD